MMVNDLIAALEKIPPMMAAGWIAWLITGALLSRWSTYERNRIALPAPTRQKSGVRASRQQQPAPFTTGDAFGDLEAMLDEKPSGAHRRPGDDSPMLANMDAPVLTNSAGAPTLSAPRSLP